MTDNIEPTIQDQSGGSWFYSEEVKDHFFNPRNVGEIEEPDGVGEVGSLACGDALKLTFKLDDDGKIKEQPCDLRRNHTRRGRAGGTGGP